MKETKRKCPACGNVKLFRADQKTCGCKATKVEMPASDRESYLRKHNAALAAENAKLHNALGSREELLDTLVAATSSLEPLPAVEWAGERRHENEMSAVFKLSDWHVGAVTKVAETEGFGEFNWALAQSRVAYIADKFLGWIATHRRSFHIPTLNIFSEGDMVSGDIHYELQVTNEFPAPVQAVKAGGLLAQMIATLAPHFERVIVTEINIDNHSRLTKKLQFAQGGENSWGYVVHAVANARLAAHENVTINQAPGIRQLVDVVGVKFLVEHGHCVKAWNGVPFYGMERHQGKEATKRMQAMLDAERKSVDEIAHDIGFDYLSIGHWHVPSIISNRILVNGCLPGTTEYDHAFGRSAPPAQVSFLVHPKYKVFDWTPWGVKQ